MTVPYDAPHKQVSPACQATRPRPGAPYAPCTGPLVPFDDALSAVLDRLMVIEDHQLAIEDHQHAIADAFTAVKALVEELVP